MQAMKLTWRIVSSVALVLSVLSAPSAMAQKKEITVGLIPSEDSRAMISQSKPMMDKLSQALGMPVVPFVAADYNGVIEALRSKRLDVAYLGPFSYVLGALALRECLLVGKAGPSPFEASAAQGGRRNSRRGFR